MAVTSLLLGNTQHGLGNLAGVTFPASVLDPATNLTVPYNPSSPGAYAPQQDAYNNAAHNVSPVCLNGISVSMSRKSSFARPTEDA